jgi:L-iditol 2-dehydrogenase
MKGLVIHMKAAVFYGKHDVRVEEHPIAEPTYGEVQIRVKAAGVCGTDLHIYEGAKGATECNPPVVLGHEFSGIVEKVGEGVSSVKPGDHVTVDPNIACHSCHYCRNGKPHLCSHLTATGVNFDGGFAELCNVLERQVFLLPEHMPFEVTAMCEPVGCCLHGIDLANIQVGDTVMIIGGGPIGLIMMQLAQMAGASKMIVVEPVAQKRALAAKLGADIVIDPTNEKVEDVLQKNGIFDVGVVIECVGRKETMMNAIDYAGRGGKALLFGLTPPDCEIPFMPFKAFQKELTVTASFTNQFTHGRAVELVSSGRLHLNDLISDVFSLDEIQKAFDMKVRVGKIIIRP